MLNRLSLPIIVRSGLLEEGVVTRCIRSRMRAGLVGAVVCLAATAGATSAGGQSSRAGGQSAEPIIIGAAMAKTGFMSQFDQPDVVGVKLAIADINKAGGILGRRVRLIGADSKSDKAQIVRAATDLIGRGAQFMIISSDFDFGGPGASVANSKNIIAFGTAGSPRFGVQGIGKNAFTMDTLSTAEGGVIAEWAYSKGWRSAYVLQDNFIDYTKTEGDAFNYRWPQLPGTKIVGSDVFQNSDPSISSQVSRIRGLSEQPDFIFLPSCTPGGASATRQIRAAGINTPIIAGACMSGDTWLKAVPGLKDFYFIDYTSSWMDSPNKAANQLVRRLIRTGKDSPKRIFSILGTRRCRRSSERSHARSRQIPTRCVRNSRSSATNHLSSAPRRSRRSTMGTTRDGGRSFRYMTTAFTGLPTGSRGRPSSRRLSSRSEAV